MVVIRWIVRIAISLVVLAVVVVLGARLHDGPLGPLPGGSLASGEVVAGPVADWSFAKDVMEIELQLESQTKSRTVWIIVHDGRAYVPAATEYPPGKTWHRAALEDGRAVLRIVGKRYPVALAKVEDEALARAIGQTASNKYTARPGGPVWFFAVQPRG
jgi:hypothetical protein